MVTHHGFKYSMECIQHNFRNSFLYSKLIKIFFVILHRDTLYRLSFTMDVKEKRVWEATESIVEMCKVKGAKDVDCHNYVIVLQNYGNQLYACGTHAFSPKCSWRQVITLLFSKRKEKNGFWSNGILNSILFRSQMDNLDVIKLDKGVAKCPFNPHANITTLMTENGKLFIGSPTDFSGTDPAILRADVAKVSIFFFISVSDFGYFISITGT